MLMKASIAIVAPAHIFIFNKFAGASPVRCVFFWLARPSPFPDLQAGLRAGQRWLVLRGLDASPGLLGAHEHHRLGLVLDGGANV